MKKNDLKFIGAKIPMSIYEEARKMNLNLSAICRDAIIAKVKLFSERKKENERKAK